MGRESAHTVILPAAEGPALAVASLAFYSFALYSRVTATVRLKARASGVRLS